MKILLIEDEIKVSAFIKKGLEENDFIVTVAYEGGKGLELFANNIFNLIILDINLPDIDGYAVCKEIRLINNKIPVLMLTANSSLDDKLRGFETGADDYLAKPFEFKELIARIKALNRRTNNNIYESEIIKIADLEMNMTTKIVKRADKTIELTAKEFQLLEYFMKNKDRVISRNEIAEKVWEINFETGTNFIDVYINFIRKKIDKDFKNKLIHTIIGMGYMFKET
jgi:DNA-binding response OmpR family regulator